MTATRDPLLEIQRQAIATMRRMVLTGMACFKAIDYQLEQSVRLLAERRARSQERTMRLFEEWARNFRKGQATYRKFVEDSFQKAVEILEKAGKGG